LMGADFFSGSGTLCQIEFEVLDRGSCGLDFSKPYGEDTFLIDYNFDEIPADVVDGYFDNTEAPPPEVHDIAVTNVTRSPTSVTVGDSISIDVTVENQGDFSETFDVAVYYDSDVVDSMTDVSLDSGDSEVLPFIWDTTGVSPDTYVISAEAFLEGDEHTENNVYVDGEVEVTEGPPPEVRDVAIIDVSPSQTIVIVGDSVSIYVTVENQGTEAETFDVTIHCNGAIIDGVTGVCLEAGETDVLSFTWDTTGVDLGIYVISAEASIVEGEEDVEDNFYEDGEVEVVEEVQPPPVGGLQVQWANYPTREYPCGDPQYPFGGQYHNGEYPVWKNFTVFNGADENIVYISVQYPETTPSFKPSKYMISVILPYDPCWTINVNLADRLVEFFAQEGGGIPPGACAIVSVEFKDGPTKEDCKVGHVFDVTVSLESCYAETFQPTEYIDKTSPNVEITFPDATSPGGQGYAFVKKKDGYIWVQTPDCTVKNIKWLWINGTASDCCSGINRVEIWINGTYMGDATLSGPVGSHTVTWSWYTDPTKNPRFWKPQSWYYVVARAYDNSVNDENTVMHGALRVPKTNSKDTVKHWFFWIGVESIRRVQLQDKPMWEGGRIIDWVPGNGRVDINGTTGFYPNGEVGIWLENELYGIKIHLTTVTADYYGGFYTTIHHLPEVPRKPACEDQWIIRAVDNKGNEGADHFAIIPWITYEDTMDQNDPKTWQTTKKGHVGDTFTVCGHGFLPSKQAEWNPYCTVYVRIYYTDVAPLEEWDYRRVFNGTSQHNWDNLEWYPKLSIHLLDEVPTDENGYWSAKIKVPQNYGGLHAIYACEYEIVADPGKECPECTGLCVCSGWSECTGIEKEAQAVIFDVWPTIDVFPSTAITDQYVTITGEGLPLPRYYELRMNGEPVVESREWCLVLDFGPYKQWVFENKRMRSNELDLSWAMEFWYPFSFYTPDPLEYPESPVWKGKLCSVTIDFTDEEAYQFHIGSKYLKVPVLPAGNCEVTVYYFDKDTGAYVHDRDAVTSVTVLKDPLNVNMEVGEIHFPGEIVDVFVQIDVDGIATDATALSLTLYKGETFIETLSPKNMGTGVYVATFDCPMEEGDYFIKASVTKEYEFFTLYGSAVAGFTVNPTLNGFNAKLIDLEGKVATLLTDVGEIKVDISEVNAKVVEIKDNIATVETDLGTLKTAVSNINATVVQIKDNIATIETDIGTLRTAVSNINAKVGEIKDKIATIDTDIGTLQTAVSDINAKVAYIEGNIVTIETDLGILKANVSDINAKVVAIEGKVITIETDIGTLEKSAESLNATIISLHDELLAIQTDMGVLLAKLEDVNGIVTIENTVATIRTELGEIKGTVVDLEGDIATIDTDIGKITAKADSIKSDVGLQPVAISLSLIAALAAIAAAVLILRKVYLK
jgi:predicted  nucleic acid-binding Zn-ribbon protein